MARILFLVSSLVIVTILGTFSDVSAQSYSSYYNSNQTICTKDAYRCPNGTMVGRTGSNCQFVCPSTVTPSPACTGVYPNYCTGLIPSSYYYTSGCYTYYYNGYTKTTSITSYNCSTIYSQPEYYTIDTNYTYPVTYSYTPASQYYTYSYCNGSWTLSYYGANGCNSIFNYGNTNYTNNGYYRAQNYNNYNCYYMNGYLTCQ